METNQNNNVATGLDMNDPKQNPFAVPATQLPKELPMMPKRTIETVKAPNVDEFALKPSKALKEAMEPFSCFKCTRIETVDSHKKEIEECRRLEAVAEEQRRQDYKIAEKGIPYPLENAIKDLGKKHKRDRENIAEKKEQLKKLQETIDNKIEKRTKEIEACEIPEGFIDDEVALNIKMEEADILEKEIELDEQQVKMEEAQEQIDFKKEEKRDMEIWATKQHLSCRKGFIDSEHTKKLDAFKEYVLPEGGLFRVKYVTYSKIIPKEEQFQDVSANADAPQFAKDNKGYQLRNQQHLSVICYGLPVLYDKDKEVNKLIHIQEVGNSSKYFKCYPQWLNDVCEIYFETSAKQIICGHEHGDRNSKCHLQCYIELEKPVTKHVKSYELHIEYFDTSNCLQPSNAWIIKYTFQSLKKNKHALKNYCLKDHDFVMLNEKQRLVWVYKLDKDGIPTDKIDVYATINKNKDILDEEQVKQLIMDHDMASYVKCHGNVVKFLDNWQSKEEPCNIIYNEDWFGKDEKGRPWLDKENIDVITSWVNNNLKIVANNETGAGGRKNCLLLFSRRCVGKTYFVEHGLIDNPNYICKFVNGLVDIKLDVEPKIVVMDDVEADDIKNHRQIYKQLICGQPCTINCKYGNRKFEYRYNPILLTNSAYLLDFLHKDADFNPYIQVAQLGRHEIMCPPEKLFQRDTKPKCNYKPSTIAILNKNGETVDPINTKEGYLKVREEYFEKGYEPDDFITILEREKAKFGEKAKAAQRQAGFFNTFYPVQFNPKRRNEKPFANKDNYHYSE